MLWHSTHTAPGDEFCRFALFTMNDDDDDDFTVKKIYTYIYEEGPKT